MSWKRYLGVGAFALLAVCIGSTHPAAADPDPEQQLLAALDQLNAGRIDDARQQLNRLVKLQPNFHLAQLVYGDLLAARAGARGSSLLGEQDDPRFNDLMDEARLRLTQWRATLPDDAVPNAILQLAPAHPYAVVVDLPRARLYLLENRNGNLSLARHYYAAMGRNGARKQVAGDLRTPVGVYHVTGFLNHDKLPEFYGAGAFPLNYPNAWDRFHGRTGQGIWLHGVPPDTYSRAPRSSEGCVTLANNDLLALKPYLQAGQTPVILSDAVEWLPHDKAQSEREEFLRQLEDWRKKWVGKNTEGYLAYYADDFSADGMNKKAFAAHKRRVNAEKKFIDVKLRDIDVFRYPGDEPLMLASYAQDYRSDNFTRTTRKDQYWRRDPSGRWKIVREENR